MQNNEGTATQEQKQESTENKSDTKLCECCGTFYGSAKTDYYCSQCYKQFKQDNTVQQQQQQQQKEIVEEKQEQPKADPSRCKTCNRKLGIYGFHCKCDNYYCNKHRVPEEHQCTFDHAEQARQQLKKNNPLVEGAKIDKI